MRVCVRSGKARISPETHLVFVYDPAPCLLVLALVEPFVLDNLVDGDMLQSRRAGELLSVRRLADTRRTRDDDVWARACHVGV